MQLHGDFRVWIRSEAGSRELSTTVWTIAPSTFCISLNSSSSNRASRQLWKADSPAAKVYGWSELASINATDRGFQNSLMTCEWCARGLMMDCSVRRQPRGHVENRQIRVGVSTTHQQVFDAANATRNAHHAAVPLRLRRRLTWSNWSRNVSSSPICFAMRRQLCKTVE